LRQKLTTWLAFAFVVVAWVVLDDLAFVEEEAYLLQPGDF
jgi:protein-S-isoprenylcysteine O-methyltransferase Ste14